MNEEVAEKKEVATAEATEAEVEPVKSAAPEVVELANPQNGKVGSVMVLGAGIAGIQAALDLADMGFKVYLVEEKSSIGGVMPQLDKTFPTNDCAMCLLSPKLVDAGRHPNIDIITNAQLEKVTGQAGRFAVTVKKRPRFVNEDKCTGCGTCVNSCPVRNEAHFEKGKVVGIELSNEELQKITAIIEKNKEKEEKLLPILQDINVQYRYLPENILRHVSREVDIPLSQIYNVATFYNAFSLTPKGQYIIQVCSGTACYVKGSQRILDAFKRELSIEVGETTKDLKFSLETVSCLGCCGQAPVLTVNEDLHGHMTQAKVSKVLAKYT